MIVDSLKFGTSGLRGLAVELLGAPSARYAAAFGRYLTEGIAAPGTAVLVGQDLRESSPAIAGAVIAGLKAAGFSALDCGALPTPALALHAQLRKLPAVMVTGSHIPADRNGLKFYLPRGEITKADEAGILKALEGVGDVPSQIESAEPEPAAHELYLDRYRLAFPQDLFKGLRVGVFQHSSVSRDDLVTILADLGVETIALGRVEHFVPIDTEAVSADVAAQAAAWVRDNRLDALVSTDGDGDRPFVVDESGTLVRGDVLGVLTAQFLGADAVVTPVTSNSAIEELGWFANVVRTKVGSPFVIAGMEEAAKSGARVAVGFEANGGVLLGSPTTINGRALAALPTRDALLPILSVLAAARQAGLTVGGLVATLPPRVARSDRLAEVPPERMQAFLDRLGDTAFVAAFFAPVGTVADVSLLDGMRFTLTSGDVVHYRASGNAPELRCYTEAATAARADELLAWGLQAAEREVR